MAFNLDEKFIANNRAIITRNDVLDDVRNNYLNYRPGMIHYISQNKSLWLSVADENNFEKSIKEPIEIVTSENFKKIFNTSNILSNAGDLAYNFNNIYMQASEPLEAKSEEVWFKLLDIPELKVNATPDVGYYELGNVVEKPELVIRTNAQNFTLIIYKNNEKIHENNFSSMSDYYSYIDDNTIQSSTEYKISIMTNVENVENEITSYTLKYNFISPIYVGTISSQIFNVSYLNNLTKLLLNDKSLIHEFTTKTSYMCLAYPCQYGEIVNITDGIGADLLHEWVKSIQRINNIDYYVYISNKCTVENYSLKFQ